MDETRAHAPAMRQSHQRKLSAKLRSRTNSKYFASIDNPMNSSPPRPTARALRRGYEMEMGRVSDIQSGRAALLFTRNCPGLPRRNAFTKAMSMAGDLHRQFPASSADLEETGC